MNGESRLEILVRGNDGALWHRWQEQRGGAWSKEWVSRGSVSGGFAGAPALALNGEGRLEVFVPGNDGALWHLWQERPGGLWVNDWVSLGSAGGGFDNTPALALNGEGRLELLARGQDGVLWHRWQERGGLWSKDWVSRGSDGGGFAGAPALALNDQGRLEVFVPGNDGALWHLWQEQRGGLWSNDWASFGNAYRGFSSTPALALNGDGRLELLAQGNDGVLWHCWQEQDGLWANEMASRGSDGGGFAGAPALALNGEGRLEVFVPGNDGALWHRWQEQRGGAWSKEWVSRGSVGGGFASTPALALNGEGRLELLVRGNDGVLWHLWQEQRAGSWSEWLSHGGFDLRLISGLDDVSGISTEGRNLIIVAAVNHMLHFRIFDGDGKLVVDNDQRSLTDQTQPIEDLRKRLEELVASPRDDQYREGPSRYRCYINHQSHPSPLHC